jgi:hypothetical protein
MVFAIAKTLSTLNFIPLILNYYCPVKNGIGKKAMLNGCKIAVE